MKTTRDIRLGTRDFAIEHRPDGAIVLANREPLEDYPERFTAMLEYWASVDPDRPFIAERHGDTWRSLTYGETLARVEALAQALLDRSLAAETPLMILVF